MPSSLSYIAAWLPSWRWMNSNRVQWFLTVAYTCTLVHMASCYLCFIQHLLFGKNKWIDKISSKEMLSKTKEDRQYKSSSRDDIIGLDIFWGIKEFTARFYKEQIKGDLKEEGGCRRHKCLQKTATWHWSEKLKTDGEWRPVSYTHLTLPTILRV